MDYNDLDNLIRLMGEEGTLSLLTPAERAELHQHMEARVQAHRATQDHTYFVGSPEWYEAKRAKFLEIINQRKEQE